MSAYSWPKGAARQVEQFMLEPERRIRVDVGFYGREINLTGRYNQLCVDYDPDMPGHRERQLTLLSNAVHKATSRELGGVHWVLLPMPPDTVSAERF